MAIGVATPTNQRMLLQPYTQRLYSGDINYTKSYIYKWVNSLTELMGQNLVMLGCAVSSSSFTNTSITVGFDAGYLLQDNAFVDLTAGCSITYPDASFFEDTGKFVVFTRFRNYHNPETHKLQVGMMYVNSSGDSENFNSNTDKIILASIDFTKLGDNINSITVSQSGTITIDGTSYTIYPRPDLDIVDGGQLPLLT